VQRGERVLLSLQLIQLYCWPQVTSSSLNFNFRAIFEFYCGIAFSIMGNEGANLITASGSVSCGFPLAASTCVGFETIDLQT